MFCAYLDFKDRRMKHPSVIQLVAPDSKNCARLGKSVMKVYDGEPVQVLFKFSSAQATRRISRARLPFWSQFFYYFKFPV